MSGLILGVIGVAGWLLVGSVTYLSLQIYVTEQQRVPRSWWRKGFSVTWPTTRSMRPSPKRAPDVGTPREPLASHLVVASRSMKDWRPVRNLAPGRCGPILQLVKPRNWRWEFEGHAVFARADREALSIRLVKDGAIYKVDRFECK